MSGQPTPVTYIAPPASRTVPHIPQVAAGGVTYAAAPAVRYVHAPLSARTVVAQAPMTSPRQVVPQRSVTYAYPTSPRINTAVYARPVQPSPVFPVGSPVVVQTLMGEPTRVDRQEFHREMGDRLGDPASHVQSDAEIAALRMKNGKRIAVLGGGPIGLEFALAAAKRGFQVTVFEKNTTVAGHMEAYQHVRLFSPWSMNMTANGKEALKSVGVPIPDLDAFPTGREIVDQYLTPLTKALTKMANVEFDTEVVSVSRGALNKMESIGGGDFRMPSNKPLADKFRKDTPFDILVSNGGVERVEEGFHFVVDCTGFYKKECANFAGKGGVPAINERNLRSTGRIWTTVPDVLGRDRARFAGRRTMLVGSGMSAATTVRFTTDLAKEAPGTELLWLVRSVGEPFKINPDDPMEAHKKLEEFGNSAARGEVEGVQYLSGSAVQAIKRVGNRLQVTIQTVDGTRVEEVDEFVSNCGFKPDTSIFQELQMQLCHATDGPYKLAATLMAGGQKSCLEQTFEGAETMTTFEPGYFILGHKSYGRSASFLLRIGHEQVAGVVDMIEKSVEIDTVEK